MKRLFFAIGAVLLFSVSALADQRITPSGVVIRGQQDVDTVLAVDGGSATSADDALWTQRDDYWIGATITVFDISSSLTDSARVITDFTAATDSLTFSAFSASITDSVTLSWPAGHIQALYPTPIIMDEGGIYTSEVYRITPGATITSQHLISASKDSVDTRIFLEIAIEPLVPNGVSAWYRIDSITNYQTVDTTAYKAWGVVQARYIRFVFDPIDAPFIAKATGNGTHYGRVMSDK